MVLNSIEKLIEKYDNGETTLKEEQKLKEYFLQDNVAPHLEAYKPLFAYFAQTQQEQYTREMPSESKRPTINLYRWMSVAAVLVLTVAVFAKMVTQPITIDSLSQEELLAYNQTIDAFNLLGVNLNKGNENINALDIMSNSLNKGTENIAYLNEFSNTQNRIFKND